MPHLQDLLHICQLLQELVNINLQATAQLLTYSNASLMGMCRLTTFKTVYTLQFIDICVILLEHWTLGRCRRTHVSSISVFENCLRTPCFPHFGTSALSGSFDAQVDDPLSTSLLWRAAEMSFTLYRSHPITILLTTLISLLLRVTCVWNRKESVLHTFRSSEKCDKVSYI